MDKDFFSRNQQVPFLRVKGLLCLSLSLGLTLPGWIGATQNVLSWESSENLWSRNSPTMLSAGGRAPNFNLLPISLCGDNLQIASWSGRGIVVHRHHEYFDMGNAIRKPADNKDILCLQEVHGYNVSVLASFKRWLPGWNIMHSGCVDTQNFADPASGGCVIAICFKLCTICEIEPKEIVPGRCLSVSLSSTAGGLQRNLQALTVHNYGLSFNQVNDIDIHMDTILQSCQPLPC